MIESATYSANLYTDNIRTAGMFTGADKSASAKSTNANSFDQVLNETSAKSETETDENSFLSFLGGLLDVINPLQHLPVISTLYRHFTGDEISPMARIAGDTLYGGPIGAAVGIANVVVERSTGQDIGENMLAMVIGDDAPTPSAENTMLAENTATPNNNIIWQETQDVPDATESLPTSAPTNLPTHAEMAGITEQADRSYEMPVHQARDYGSESLRLTALAFTTEDADEEITAQPSVQSDQVLQSQKTPAAIAGTAEPSELIANMPVPRDMVAARMAEALDKYAAMKRAGL